MGSNLEIPIIGIDRGATYTDFAIVESGRLKETFSLENRGWDAISSACARLKAEYQSDRIVFSGCATGMPAAMQERVNVIAEIDAIGFGGAALAKASDCVVVSMGTGTAIVHFTSNSAKHIGGSGVGGGTIKGLGSLICGMEDPLQLDALAMKGSASNLNLTISDLGYEEISFLGADMTAGELISTIILTLGVLTTLMYFFFSKPHSGVLGGTARVGIIFLMVAFGASFGYTVMGRISLLIGRFTFLFSDWLKWTS